MSNRAVARLQNVDEKTVRNIAAADKEHSAEIPHLSDAAKEKHRELASPPAENWAGEGRRNVILRPFASTSRPLIMQGEPANDEEVMHAVFELPRADQA